MSGPYSICKFILFPIPPTSPRPLCYTVAMGVNGMDKTADDWRRFAQTGSIYDYLTYKNQQTQHGRTYMQVATTGLVLRQVKVGEADRILTILTPDLGVVSASARGSLRMKSALFSATGLFCYSEFTLTSGRSHYFVDTAQVKKVFHGISASIEGMALASYMAEIAAELSPAPPEADAQLRLLLNCLYMISERHYPCAQLKAIYELRALTLAGYMPDVLACAGCGKYDGGEFYLDPVEGRLLCADCAEKAHHITNLDNGALYALRHICLAEDKKLFGFKISPESLQELSRTSEQYTLAHLEHGLKSLDFLKSVLE